MKKHLYSFRYDTTESELCKLESKYIFNQTEENKVLLTDMEVEPSISTFIKRRLDIITTSEDYFTLIKNIKSKNICTEGFKVEYLVLKGDQTKYKERLVKLKDIGFSIEGEPDYYNPTTTYGLCFYEGIWYFGVLIKNNYDRDTHKEKPCSYSNSININIAKALVNIAARADKNKKLIDACCGVGTIMLEACLEEYNIEGCDINWKICRDARENIAYFNYSANVFRSDVKDISKNYDAAIIDLPYNLLSSISDTDVLHIISSTTEITKRIVIVSTTDITKFIKQSGLRISDYCNVHKPGNVTFKRKIWVCEKEA